MKDEFYDDEVQKLMKKVLKMQNVGGDLVLPTRRLKKKVALDDEGDDDEDEKKDAGKKEAPRKEAPKKAAAKLAVDEDSGLEDDEVSEKKGIWMVVVGDKMTTGTVIEKPPGGTLSQRRGERFAFFPPRRLGDLPLILKEVEIDGVQAESMRLKEKVKFCAGARDGDEEEGERLPPEFATKGGSSGDNFGGLRGDLRILPVKFDEAGERARRLDETVPYVIEQEFEDWPLDAVRNTRYVMRQLRSGSRTWLTSHTEWVKYSGIRNTDRAIHEHKLLSKALDLAQSYDQLHMVNLACVEVLVFRRMLIESAYRGHPDTPKYTGGEYMLGYREDDAAIINPAALQYVSKKMKQDTEVMKEHRLKVEEEAAVRKPPQGPK